VIKRIQRYSLSPAIRTTRTTIDALLPAFSGLRKPRIELHLAGSASAASLSPLVDARAFRCRLLRC